MAQEEGSAVSAWWDRAACKGVATEVFFPEIPKGDNRTFYWRKAKEFCKTCTVVDECLAFVLPFEEISRGRHGFWAGMTPKEREAYSHTPTPVRFRDSRNPR